MKTAEIIKILSLSSALVLGVLLVFVAPDAGTLIKMKKTIAMYEDQNASLRHYQRVDKQEMNKLKKELETTMKVLKLAVAKGKGLEAELKKKSKVIYKNRIVHSKSNRSKRGKVGKIRKGMTQEEVLSIVGDPDQATKQYQRIFWYPQIKYCSSGWTLCWIKFDIATKKVVGWDQMKTKYVDFLNL